MCILLSAIRTIDSLPRVTRHKDLHPVLEKRKRCAVFTLICSHTLFLWMNLFTDATQALEKVNWTRKVRDPANLIFPLSRFSLEKFSVGSKDTDAQLVGFCSKLFLGRRLSLSFSPPHIRSPKGHACSSMIDLSPVREAKTYRITWTGILSLTTGRESKQKNFSLLFCTRLSSCLFIQAFRCPTAE